MNSNTAAALQRLDEAEWFSCVGIKDTENTIVLSSWDEAIKHCSSLKWENLCLEATNQYRERLVERSRDRFVKWNDVGLGIRGVGKGLGDGKIGAVVGGHHLPNVFRQCVGWDIGHLCMEMEYADVFPPGFYSSQAYWYERGHFPCGWKGR